MKPATPFQVCRVCGCTQERACECQLGPCFWIEENLCSWCALKVPDPKHAAVFTKFLTQAAPELVFQTYSWATMRALVSKGVLTEDEIRTEFLREVAKVAGEIQQPGRIILPG